MGTGVLARPSRAKHGSRIADDPTSRLRFRPVTQEQEDVTQEKGADMMSAPHPANKVFFGALCVSAADCQR